MELLKGGKKRKKKGKKGGKKRSWAYGYEFKLRAVSRVRTLFIWLAVLEMEYTGREVAQWLGITPSAVSKGLRQGRMPENREEIARIVKELST